MCVQCAGRTHRLERFVPGRHGARHDGKYSEGARRPAADHRAATLASVMPGKLTAADALARIDAVRRLDRIAHHAWRSAAHLLGRGAHDDLGPSPQPESTG